MRVTASAAPGAGRSAPVLPSGSEWPMVAVAALFRAVAPGRRRSGRHVEAMHAGETCRAVPMADLKGR